MWTVWQISVARFLYNYSSRFRKFVEHMIYKNKIFCQAMDINNQSSKEIFMGDIQESTRMCTVWYYPFVIEPLSHFGQQSVQAIPLVRSWNLHLNKQYIKQQKKKWSSLFLGTKMPYKHSHFGIAQAVCI
uniref:Uncharacterized protein n=1 Tax=Aegilops tauschii subsp. strangulata TaxID=200361 RepID=A0A453P9R1_AEGTS